MLNILTIISPFFSCHPLSPCPFPLGTKKIGKKSKSPKSKSPIHFFVCQVTVPDSFLLNVPC